MHGQRYLKQKRLHSIVEIFVEIDDEWFLGLGPAPGIDAGFCLVYYTEFCVDVLKKAIARYGAPEIINSDQGRQFTCEEWKTACGEHPGMRISMDGRGRAKDNIWIERFWRTIKYDYTYIQPEENGAALYQGILRFIDDYNYHRRHQGIDRQVPSKLYLRSTA